MTSAQANPPLRPLTFDQLDAQLADVLRPRYERLGYLGGFFAAMGRQPAALAHFEHFTLSLREALSPALGEVVALTAATRLDNRYERHQHERLAVNRGLSHEWIAAVERGARDGTPVAELDDAERAAQTFVLAALTSLAGPGSGDDDPTAPLRALVAATDETTATAVVLLAARFTAHALVSRVCALTPPVPSIFDPEGEPR